MVAAEHFASVNGISLSEKCQTKFDTEKECPRDVDRLKSEFPEKPSAYMPGGKMPLLTTVLMFVAFFLGGPAGFLAAYNSAIIQNHSAYYDSTGLSIYFPAVTVAPATKSRRHRP